MSGTASQTNEQAGTVASAAQQMSANVQTVSASAEELGASINEISRQVAQSAEITAKAVRDAAGVERITRVAYAGHNDQPFQSVVRTLLDRGEISDATPRTLAAWRVEALQQIEEAVAKVQREPGPDPYREDWCALASKHLSEGGEMIG